MKSELEYVLQELAQYMIYGQGNVKNAYKEEKIIQLDKNNANINDIYKKFKRIEQSNFWKMYDDEIFYRQAKFLENFEDNYETQKIYRHGYNDYETNCTYSNFSLQDFRIYFTWRTKIKKGEFKEIPYKYEQIYINELLNKIGCKNSKDAIDKLIAFWKGYRVYSLDLDFFMPDIIKEYYIINNINIPYSEIVKTYPIKINNISKDLKEINKGIYSKKIEFLNNVSSYKIGKSKLLETKYGYVLDECIEKVFVRINQEFENKGISLSNMLMHKCLPEHWWKPLGNYTVYQIPTHNKEIIIEGTEKYECKNGIWSRTRYTYQDKYKNTIGFILKTMECHIREYLGYRKLKFPEKGEVLKDIGDYYCSAEDRIMINKICKMDLQKIIQAETLKYLLVNKIPRNEFKKKKEEKDIFEKEEKIEVVFNQENFAKIREKSEEIQKALIIEEENQENEIKNNEIVIKDVAEILVNIEEKNIKEVAKTPVDIEEKTIKEVAKIPVEIEENVYKKFTYNLTEPEKEIIQVLLKKENIENKILQIAQKHNEMLEVMVSNINDKALETIGDTIIEADMSCIYEDYESEIKQVL